MRCRSCRPGFARIILWFFLLMNVLYCLILAITYLPVFFWICFAAGIAAYVGHSFLFSRAEKKCFSKGCVCATCHAYRYRGDCPRCAAEERAETRPLPPAREPETPKGPCKDCVNFHSLFLETDKEMQNQLCRCYCHGFLQDYVDPPQEV